MTRTIEALVEEQARRWQLVRNERHEDVRRPVKSEGQPAWG